MSATTIMNPSAIPSSTSSSSTKVSAPSQSTQVSRRVNGKNWHAPREAFRPTKALTSYEARRAKDKARAVTLAREKEMKEEKQAARDELVAKIKDRRNKKAERERWQMVEAKMHKKRVERLKRREKRNKMLNS